MLHKEFVPETSENLPEKGKVTWQSPSNIALVKYWGKKRKPDPGKPVGEFYPEQLPQHDQLSVSTN